MTLEEFSLRLALAIAAGSFIGFERQWINRIAGMQTNALVCAGACLFILASDWMTGEGQAHSRIAAQIVSGIGFLGAGMIFKEGFTAHGINTAATVWATAGIGVLIGIGELRVAGAASVLLVVANIAIRKFDHLIAGRRRHLDRRMVYHYDLKVLCTKEQYASAREYITDLMEEDPDVTLQGVKTDWKKSENCEFQISISSRHLEKGWIQKSADSFGSLPGVLVVDWRQR